MAEKTVLERRAWFVYEAGRLQAIAVGALVPEPWSDREPTFRDQFLEVIEMMCGSNRQSSPEELHDDWVKAYAAMGWVYGPQRDPERKTHPDLLPFNQLEPRERDKDAVFVALCEIARQWINCGSASNDPAYDLYWQVRDNEERREKLFERLGLGPNPDIHLVVELLLNRIEALEAQMQTKK